MQLTTEELISRLDSMLSYLGNENLNKYFKLLKEELNMCRNHIHALNMQLEKYKDMDKKIRTHNNIVTKEKLIKKLKAKASSLEKINEDKEKQLIRLRAENEQANKLLGKVLTQEEKPITEYVKEEELQVTQDETKLLKKSNEDGVSWTKPIKTGWNK